MVRPVEVRIAQTLASLRRHRTSIIAYTTAPGALLIVAFGIGPTFTNGVFATVGTLCLIVSFLFGCWDYRLKGIDSEM